MPAMGVPREATDLIETTAVRFRTGQKSTMLHSASLQNPTEWRRNSPFFGSVLRRFLLAGTAGDPVIGAKDGISLLWIFGENYHFKPMEAVTKKRDSLLW